jgi:hypothetical protein
MMVGFTNGTDTETRSEISYSEVPVSRVYVPRKSADAGRRLVSPHLVKCRWRFFAPQNLQGLSSRPATNPLLVLSVYVRM